MRIIIAIMLIIVNNAIYITVIFAKNQIYVYNANNSKDMFRFAKMKVKVVFKIKIAVRVI